MLNYNELCKTIIKAIVIQSLHMFMIVNKLSLESFSYHLEILNYP